MTNIQNYKPHSKVTKEMLKDNNFKFIDGLYVYHFPVYKVKKEVLIWGNLYIDIDNNICNLNVLDQNNNTYAPFFNRLYGKNKVVESIERKINAQLSMFVKNNILKKRGKK